MARPRKKIDPKLVLRLAAIQCSYAEIAACVGCNESTLTRRFAQVIQKGREHGRQSLKRAQYKLAMGGNATMLIWLGKQHLGQQDRQALEMSGPAGGPIEVVDYDTARKKLGDRLSGVASRITPFIPVPGTAGAPGNGNGHSNGKNGHG